MIFSENRFPLFRIMLARCDVLRPTAPRLHVRDDRETPLCDEAGCAKDAGDLPDEPSGLFFAGHLDTGHPSDGADEMNFSAR